jgi:hypothetical protein
MVRLRTRRSGVRVPPGAPYFSITYIHLIIFQLAKCPWNVRIRARSHTSTWSAKTPFGAKPTRSDIEEPIYCCPFENQLRSAQLKIRGPARVDNVSRCRESSVRRCPSPMAAGVPDLRESVGDAVVRGTRAEDDSQPIANALVHVHHFT